MTFENLDLIPQLLQAIEEVGYTTPSPIQAEAIPPVLAGRDLIGCAQTGTGKTAVSYPGYSLAFFSFLMNLLHGLRFDVS